MRYFAIFCGLGMLACFAGGSPSSDGGTTSGGAPDLKLENNYAESLFTVRYTVNGGNDVTVFDNLRLAANASETGTIVAPAGSTVEMTVVGTSLGENHSFTLKGPAPTTDVRVVYDYDLATAAFIVKSNWGIDQPAP